MNLLELARISPYQGHITQGGAHAENAIAKHCGRSFNINLKDRRKTMIQRTVIVFVALILAVSSLAMAADDPATGVVNINTAGSEQLQLLPRVGPALADRIIEFRETNGLFASIDELVAVKGIGETSLVRLEPYISTSGATTLESKVRLPRSSASGSPAS